MLAPGARSRQRRRAAAALLFAVVGLFGELSAYGAGEIPAAPVRWATDSAGFLSESARASLDARLEAYEARTGHQFLVFIARTTDGVPIEDFAVRAFKAWAVGRRGKDDGLVLFIFADDRTARFEVGYGLEGSFTDVAASRVIREVLAPRIQAGDREGAVSGAVEAATAEIARNEGTSSGITGEGGQPAPGFEPRARRGVRQPLSTAEKIFLLILVAVVLFIVVTNPALALYLLQVIASGGGSGGGGWGGGGGGGFSGGGGRSGGGGASGSW